MAILQWPTGERRTDLRAMGLLALVVVIFYADVLFFGANFFTRDLAHYHYPMKFVVRELVLGGDFPYWNRLYSAGQPVAANPAYEVFYPPQWLTLLPDYNYGFGLHIVVHFFIAAFGGYLFLRSLALRASTSFIGAFAFVMSGPYVSTVNLLPFLFSISWTPWIALYARRWLLGRRARDFAAAAMFLGVQALVCEPTTLAQTWGVVGLYAAWTGYGRGGPRVAARTVAAAVGLVLVGLAVAAVQVVPAIDHAADSVRAAGFDFETVSKWSLSPVRFVEEVYPNALGTLEGLYWGQIFSDAEKGPYLQSLYLSLLTIALTAAGVAGRVAGRGLTAAVALPAFLFALGDHTPLLGMLYRAGLLPSIRYPEKFILSASFALLTYGAIVLDRVLEGDSALGRKVGWICAGTGIVAAAVFLVCLAPGYDGWFAAFWGVGGDGPASIARTQWLIAAVRGLGFFVAMRALSSDPGRKALALLGLVLLADLGPLGNQVNPRVPRSYFDEVPAIVRQLDTGDSRLAHVASMQLGARERGPYFDSGAGYWVMRNGLWPSMPALHGIATCLELDVDETQLLRTRAVLDLVKALSDRGVYDWYSIVGPMYGSGSALVYRDPDAEFKRVGDDWSRLEPVEVDPAPRHPRYFFASEVVQAESDARLTEMLALRRWHPATAFVRSESRRVAGGRVRSLEETPNRTVLDVETQGDAFLVMATTHHKYWSATVDGRPVSIAETNIAFQGIELSGGRHRVELRYRNPLILAGACVSLVALAALALASRRGHGAQENRSLETTGS